MEQVQEERVEALKQARIACIGDEAAGKSVSTQRLLTVAEYILTGKMPEFPADKEEVS